MGSHSEQEVASKSPEGAALSSGTSHNIIPFLTVFIIQRRVLKQSHRIQLTGKSNVYKMTNKCVLGCVD